MNKGEFVNLIAETSGQTKADAEKNLDLVINSIIEAHKRGEDVNLIGFGAFTIQQRAAREGRNPRTGEKMQIAAYKQPSFKAGKKLKDACN